MLLPLDAAEPTDPVRWALPRLASDLREELDRTSDARESMLSERWYVAPLLAWLLPLDRAVDAWEGALLFEDGALKPLERLRALLPPPPSTSARSFSRWPYTCFSFPSRSLIRKK